MSHEQSETIQLPGGRWANVYGRRTPRAGERLDDIDYPTTDEAVSAARIRSESYVGAYADLIPGSSPSRRRSAYDDLLPGGAPAATVQPAEDARLAGVEAATVPRVADVAREALPSMWGEMPLEEPMVPAEPTDAADNLYQPPGAEWGQVLRSIIPGAGAQIRSAVANLRRQSNEESIGGREMVLEPPSDPNSPQEVAYGQTLRKARERQQTRLAQEIAARPEIQADAAAARQDLAAATPQDMSTVQQAVHSAGTSAPTTLAGLAAGIATRSPAVGMAIAGGGGSTIQAGSTYGEALERLLSDGVPKGEAHRRASLAAIGDAAIEGFDAIPVGVALKRGSAVAKRILKTAGVESFTEGGQQLLQDLRSMAMENPELTLGEMWQNLKVAVLSGGIGGSVYGGIGSAANAGRKDASEGTGEAPVAEEVSTPAQPTAPAVPAPVATSPYADLIPGADLEGRVEPSINDVPSQGAITARVTDESAQFEERSAAAEAAWTAKVDAMNARQTAKIEAAKAAAGTEQSPVEGAIPDDAKDMLRVMAENSGHMEVGGRVMREHTGTQTGGDAVGVTRWVGQPEWAKGLGANPAEVKTAVEKAIAGKTLGKKQKDIVKAMLDEIAATRANIGEAEWSGIGQDLQTEQLEPTHQNTVDADLVARAVAIDEAAVESAAVQYDNDDAAFMAEMQRIINGQQVQNAEAAGGRPADRGQAQGFELEQQTEAALEARARAQAEAEARRLTEEQASENKRRADAQRGDFTLTGSERTADVNPQQGVLGMPKGVTPEVTAVDELRRKVLWLEDAIGQTNKDLAEMRRYAAKNPRYRTGSYAAEFARLEADEKALQRDLGKARRDLSSADRALAKVPPLDDSRNQGSLFDMPEGATPRRTDTPKFKRWFGESKVVDAEGNPLRVYHGTDKDIPEFAVAPRVQRGASNRIAGAWFTANPQSGSDYATNPYRGGGAGANVIPVYLSIQNPYIITLRETGDYKRLVDGLTPERIEQLAGQGYDGVIVNTEESAPFVEKAEFVEIVAFRPEQIKSVFNENPTNSPKILGMPAGAITAGTVPTAVAGGATPPARAKAAVGKESARPDAIRTAMRELFGAPISEKHQGAKNLGIYRIKPQTIRLRNRNDLRTAAHEVGHHISERNQPFRAVMKQHAAELISIMPAAYKAQVAAGKHMPKKLQIEEGFAEFIADYITEPTTLQAKVPGFYKAFETWLGQNPEYAQSLQRVADMVGAHEALDPADRILAKVGMFKPPFGQRVATLASKDTWDTFAQATLDKWHPLKVMVEDLAPGVATSKNPYAAARLLAGDAAIIEDWVSDFTTPFDYTKRLDGKNYGKPLRAIFEPILKGGEVEINKFKAYLIARRAFELKRAGKENLFTTEEIAQGLSLETPLFKNTAAEVYAYNDRLVDYAVEGGLLSPEVAAKFKQYANYIPFFRESEGEGKAGGRGDPFKRLMGGTANLRDPIANLIQNTANIIHATNRNAMVRKAVELAKAVRGGGRWIESVPLPQQAHNISTQRILDELQKQGVQIDTTMAQDMAAIQTFFMPSGKGDERTRTIVYKQGGELKAAQVNDPILWKALGNIPPLQMGLLNKILAFPAQTLRAGVVLDPTFMVRNGVRDTLSATVQSKGKFIPVLSTAQGIKMMAQSRDSYRLWRAFGGGFADQFRDSDEAVRVIQRMGRRGGFSPDSIITPTRWLDALKRVGAFTEAGSRVGEFKATYKPGDIDSALQAALNAREVSTDFGMRGGSEAIQILTRMTPFMNPAMQGLYKTARVLSTGDGKAAAVKAAILGTNMALLSMALALINSDEAWYREIEEWEKTTYWHFKVGEQVYRIPKPFEYGTLFASMPEAIVLLQQGKEGWEDFKKRMLQALGFVFGFRVIPQVGTLVMEPWANKSFFTGRKLVPDRQRDLEPGLQAHPYSSKVAQVAGEAANVSPAVIDNVVRNFFGTMGVHASTVADLMLEQTGAFPPGRERSWQNWPAIKAFVRDPENPNSKQMRDFYEALEKYRRAVKTVKEYRNRGEDDKADRYAESKSEDISMAKSAEVASRRLAKLRKAVRQIEWTRDMTPTEKRETVRDYNEEMQSIAAEQTRLYQAASKSGAAQGVR